MEEPQQKRPAKKGTKKGVKGEAENTNDAETV